MSEFEDIRCEFWPYRVLKRDDDDVRCDLDKIMRHFVMQGKIFDTVVFVPYAGKYLSELFAEKFGSSFDVDFVTVRRVSTVSKDNLFKKFIFKRKWLSNRKPLSWLHIFNPAEVHIPLQVEVPRVAGLQVVDLQTVGPILQVAVLAVR